MAKRLKADESGDNEELQALFDSIADAATEGKNVTVESEENNTPIKSEATEDSAELQALFDSVIAQKNLPIPEERVDIKSAVAAAATMSAEERHEQAFVKIGQLTRLLHDTIRQLGYDRILEETAEKLPDARQRLNYISQMTEQAASRVLNATDIAKPIQDKLYEHSSELSTRWSDLYDKKMSIEAFKTLAGDTHVFLKQTQEDSKVVNDQLLEIMMAQDFQDLTGQVIKKIVDMTSKLEDGLLKVLIDIMPEEKRSQAQDGLLNGPVVDSNGRDDVVTSQEQVDDLLESLGF